MKIKLATQGWNGAEAADTHEGTEVGVRFLWAEIDGHRFDDVIDAKVEIGNTSTKVTISFLAAVEMVLLDRHGHVLIAVPQGDTYVARDGSGNVIMEFTACGARIETEGRPVFCRLAERHAGNHVATVPPNGTVSWGGRG